MPDHRCRHGAQAAAVRVGAAAGGPRHDGRSRRSDDRNHQSRECLRVRTGDLRDRRRRLRNRRRTRRGNRHRAEGRRRAPARPTAALQSIGARVTRQPEDGAEGSVAPDRLKPRVRPPWGSVRSGPTSSPARWDRSLRPARWGRSGRGRCLRSSSVLRDERGKSRAENDQRTFSHDHGRSVPARGR